MTKHCPVPGCGWTIRDGAVLCAHHWLLLPESVRREARRLQAVPPRKRDENAKHALRQDIQAALARGPLL